MDMDMDMEGFWKTEVGEGEKERFMGGMDWVYLWIVDGMV